MKTIYVDSFSRFKFLVALLAASFVLWGCDSASPQLDESFTSNPVASSEAPPDEAAWSVQEFRDVYSNNLADAGSYLEANNAKFSDRAVARQAVLDGYSAGSEEYQAAADAFDAEVSGSHAPGNLPDNVQQVILRVDQAIEDAETHDAFQQALSTMQAEVQVEAEEENWSEEARQQALSHIIVVKETMSFVETNFPTYTQNGIFGDFFGSFEFSWKCVAGTVGSAATGFVSGGWLGAAGGALVGAATFCVESE